MVGSGIQVFLFKNYIFGWDCLRATWFSGEMERQARTGTLHRGKRYGNKQSCENVVTAIVSWAILSLHVCA